MNIHFLKTFISLARTKSFRAAARENAVTQSAVSQQVRTLESRLNKVLIERSGRKLGLTPSGEIFLQHAERIVNQYNEALHQLQDEPAAIGGQVRVSTIYSIGLYRLQPLIKKFLKKHRNINVHLEYHHNDVIYERVQQNIDDFGVVAFPTEVGRITEHVLGTDSMILVQNSARPQFSKKQITVEEFNAQRHVALSTTTPTGREIYHHLRSMGVTTKAVAQFENVETLKSAVHVGMGCAVLPKNIVKSELKTKAFDQIKLPGVEMERPVGLISTRDRTPTLPRTLFFDLLRDNNLTAERKT